MDTHLRELERSAALGDPGAQTRLLTERVRAGDLDADRLSLAAFLGDPQALEATEAQPVDVPLTEWVWTIGVSHGKEAGVRAGVALARCALDQRSGLPDRPDAGTLRAVEAAEAWCQRPGKDGSSEWWILEEAKKAALLAVGVDRDLAFLAIELVQAAWEEDIKDVSAHLSEVSALALRVLTDDLSKDAVRAALVPWALGQNAPWWRPIQ